MCGQLITKSKNQKVRGVGTQGVANTTCVQAVRCRSSQRCVHSNIMIGVPNLSTKKRWPLLNILLGNGHVVIPPSMESAR